MLNPWSRALPVAVALATLSCAVSAQQQALAFNLPAGPLAATLNAIASQSGQIISLDPALVQGRQAPAVRGQMSAEQALQAALAGSGLQLLVTGSGHFSVVQGVSADGALELGATSITEVRNLATTEGSNSYAARVTTIGKGEHTLKEIPQSVSVMTRSRWTTRA